MQAIGMQAYLTSLGRSTKVGRRILAPMHFEVALRTCSVVGEGTAVEALRVFEQCPMLLLHGEMAPFEVMCSPQVLAQVDFAVSDSDLPIYSLSIFSFFFLSFCMSLFFFF